MHRVALKFRSLNSVRLEAQTRSDKIDLSLLSSQITGVSAQCRLWKFTLSIPVLNNYLSGNYIRHRNSSNDTKSFKRLQLVIALARKGYFLNHGRSKANVQFSFVILPFSIKNINLNEFSFLRHRSSCLTYL